jgi:hypothetical protein
LGALVSGFAISDAAAVVPLATPTFVAGPVSSGGTLIWQDTAGIEALSRGGAPRLVLRGGTLSEVTVGGGWIALVANGEVLAGPADGKLVAVRLPRGCEPLAAEASRRKAIASSLAARALFAISGRRLYDVVGSSCHVGRRPERSGLRLVAFAEDGHYAGLVRRLARRPLAVSAAGTKIAIVGSAASGGPYTITVVGLRGSHVTTFDTLARSEQVTTAVQNDDAGDVFANVFPAQTPIGPPGEYDDTSGFVVPSDGAAFELAMQITITPHVGPVPETALSMSEGKLAFLHSTEEIEVLDVASRAIIGMVKIAPGNEVLGIAIDGTELAWIEQPVAYELWPPEASRPGTGPTCSYDREPTGPPSIERVSLAEIATTTVTVGSSPAPVACAMRPPPP